MAHYLYHRARGDVSAETRIPLGITIVPIIMVGGLMWWAIITAILWLSAVVMP